MVDHVPVGIPDFKPTIPFAGFAAILLFNLCSGEICLRLSVYRHAFVDILNANLPEYATSAKTDNVFFHRGFTGRPMVCGSVEFYRDDTLVMDFQRFIYPGLQLVYYENDTRNFEIYWDKVCQQTSDDYLPN